MKNQRLFIIVMGMRTLFALAAFSCAVYIGRSSLYELSKSNISLVDKKNKNKPQHFQSEFCAVCLNESCQK